MNKLIQILFCSTLLSGCVSAPAIRVPDAKGLESVSAIGMSCSSPFELTQDCSGWSGPTKRINIGGREVKVAGNTSGTITVLFGENNSKATQTTNLGYELLKRELVSKGFEIIKVTPIESAGLMFGYAVETSKSNYHVWNEFSVK